MTITDASDLRIVLPSQPPLLSERMQVDADPVHARLELVEAKILDVNVPHSHGVAEPVRLSFGCFVPFAA